jgi:hypothetical protein
VREARLTAFALVSRAFLVIGRRAWDSTHGDAERSPVFKTGPDSALTSSSAGSTRNVATNLPIPCFSSHGLPMLVERHSL